MAEVKIVTHGKQVDLGVKYSHTDYDEAVTKKAGVYVNEITSLYLGSNFRTEGRRHIDQTFSSAEISSIQNLANSKKGPFHDVHRSSSRPTTYDHEISRLRFP
jgi:hypothetical protein